MWQEMKQKKRNSRERTVDAQTMSERTSHLPSGGVQSSVPSGCILPVKSIRRTSRSHWTHRLRSCVPIQVALRTNAAFSSKRLTRASECRTISATYSLRRSGRIDAEGSGIRPFGPAGHRRARCRFERHSKVPGLRWSEGNGVFGASPPGRWLPSEVLAVVALLQRLLGAPTPVMEASSSPGSGWHR